VVVTLSEVEPTPRGFNNTEALLVSLARELAINFRPLPEILEHLSVSYEDWDVISTHPRFVTILEQQVAEWHSATNTHERTRLKTAAMIEDWLPEAHARLHDGRETLNSKVELAKLVARIGGMGLERAAVSGGDSEKVVVTINLGNHSKLQFEQQAGAKVINVDED